MIPLVPPITGLKGGGIYVGAAALAAPINAFLLED